LARFRNTASIAALAAVLASPAIAQQTVGEVIVTAQKRAENVQDVPQSVAVVTAEQLEARGVRSFTDVSKLSPSIAFAQGDHPTNHFVRIRGIGAQAFSVAAESSTAVQIDDVPVMVQGRSYTDLVDIARIEVLRGPQSTLYGKSASAGLISIYTQDPSRDLTGKMTALATTDEEYRVAGTISGPITDTLAFRITGSLSDFAGTQTNLATGKKVNGSQDSVARGKFVWTPREELTVTALLNYNRTKADCCSPSLIYLHPDARLRGVAGLPASVAIPGVTPGPENTDVNFNRNYYVDSEEFGQALKVEWTLSSGHTLLSVTSHDRYKYLDGVDNDQANAPLPQFANTNNLQDGHLSSKAITQELRIVSPGEDAFRYVAGLFYASTDNSRSLIRGPYFNIARWLATAGNVNTAAFGQIDWTFLPRTTVIAGARIQKEELEYTFYDDVAKTLYSGNTEDTYSTYRLGLRHELTEDVMVFGSFATGHKGQAYDLTTGFDATRAKLGAVQPETSDSWEVGLKSQFFDRRLTLNVTGFDVTYENLQQQTTEFRADGTAFFILRNVGAVSTRGLEIESAWRVTDALGLSAAVTYVDAQIDSYPVAPCYNGQTLAEGCRDAIVQNGVTIRPRSQDLGGVKLGVPELAYNVSADYQRDLGDLPFQFIATAFYSWQQGYQAQNRDPLNFQEAYGILNLSAGIRHPEDRYEIVAFVNNALDEHYVIGRGADRGIGWGNTLSVTARQARDFRRYAGVRLSVTF
jgi:iron complex outermembrane receptor protein